MSNLCRVYSMGTLDSCLLGIGLRNTKSGRVNRPHVLNIDYCVLIADVGKMDELPATKNSGISFLI